MFIKAVISTVGLAVALNATAAFADNIRWNGAQSGGASIQKKAPRPNGMNVRFADQFKKGGTVKATTGGMRLGSTPYSKYQRVAPSGKARFGTTAHVTKKGANAKATVRTPAKRVHFDSSKNTVRKIEKIGQRPVNGGKASKSGSLKKKGMSTKEARALNAQKKANSPKYKAYKHSQHKLAKKSGGLKVRNGNVVAPKNALFGTTRHLSNTRKGVKNSRKVTKTAKHLKKGAKIAKTGKKLRTVGKLATGGAVGMVAGAALGVKVPDAVDAAMFAGKLVTDPKNAPKRLYGVAKGGVRMVGTAANAITDPSRMARNLHGAAKGVGRSIAKTKVYKNLAKTKTGRTIGKATKWTGKKVGAGYNKFKKTKTAKAIGKAAKTVDKQVFKRANKGVKTVGKVTKKASKKIAKGAKKTAKKIGKGAKKVAKKLKFW